MKSSSPFFDHTPDISKLFIGQRFRYICHYPDIIGRYILTQPVEDYLALINLETGKSYKEPGLVYSEGGKITVAAWDQLADIHIWPEEAAVFIQLEISEQQEVSDISPNQLRLFA